ncbi:uncharacterized protein PGTG_04073 [Puccinia graminis f. sp. tritici CRL 75-36-700-3]|uniref:Uncharacterized protein n=1 Tax=Puccinia graminis f. sp. tritici (strain CRL 75-36-700-3 / race SCCL) TaxID=418459 RepID=E3K1E2_PUCGT|nr:uncharacterized protein PGTG_04073 [Puccinia graminis f. sp. tritici CRL 75-36-700-3]EFP78117.2 hypothetical protein PGTG_04073 [Puccinia graminis f. sp. tritici CRL 75-36-700-3]
MPCQTKQGLTIAQMTQQIQHQVDGAILNYLLNDSNNESTKDSNLEDAIVALILLKKQRYHTPHTRLDRNPDNSAYLFSLNDSQFKQKFRMLQPFFFRLFNEIKGHPVFHNQSNILKSF